MKLTKNEFVEMFLSEQRRKERIINSDIVSFKLGKYKRFHATNSWNKRGSKRGAEC